MNNFDLTFDDNLDLIYIINESTSNHVNSDINFDFK